MSATLRRDPVPKDSQADSTRSAIGRNSRVPARSRCTPVPPGLHTRQPGAPTQVWAGTDQRARTYNHTLDVTAADPPSMRSLTACEPSVALLDRARSERPDAAIASLLRRRRCDCQRPTERDGGLDDHREPVPTAVTIRSPLRAWQAGPPADSCASASRSDHRTPVGSRRASPIFSAEPTGHVAHRAYAQFSH